MTKRPNLTDLAAGYASNTQLNNNFQLIEEAFDNTLSRDGSTPNTMEADLDMNGNQILNTGNFSVDELTVGGVRLVDASAVPSWKGAWETGVEYQVDDLIREEGQTYICLETHTSGTFSTDLTANKWELFAAKGAPGDGTGDMLASNNLSELTSNATARANLGLSNLAITTGSSFALTLLDDEDAAEARATLGTLDAAETLTNKTMGDGTAVETGTSNWTGTVTLDPANGLIQTVTLTGNVTSVTDSLVDGESVLLAIDDGADYTITWPTMTWVSDDGTAPVLQTDTKTFISIWKLGSILYGFASNGG